VIRRTERCSTDGGPAPDLEVDVDEVRGGEVDEKVIV
jgi:hypothetical protein